MLCTTSLHFVEQVLQPSVELRLPCLVPFLFVCGPCFFDLFVSCLARLLACVCLCVGFVCVQEPTLHQMVCCLLAYWLFLFWILNFIVLFCLYLFLCFVLFVCWLVCLFVCLRVTALLLLLFLSVRALLFGFGCLFVCLQGDEPNVWLRCLIARSSDTIKGVGSF